LVKDYWYLVEETRDAAKHPVIHMTTSPNKELFSQTVSGAKVKKPSSRRKYGRKRL
jgi:hypothetical protein